MDTLKKKNKIKKFMQKHTQKAVFGEPQWKSNKFQHVLKVKKKQKKIKIDVDLFRY